MNELYHHGIRGQKWGVRRYQNTDGTRTSAGKRREKAGRSPEERARASEKRKMIAKRVVTAAAVLGTAAAAAHYAKNNPETVKKVMNIIKSKQNIKYDVHPDYAKAHNVKKLHQLSDKELTNINKRLNMEQQYNKLKPKQVSAGTKAVNKVLKTTGTITAVTSGVLAVSNNANRIKQMFENSVRSNQEAKKQE